MVAPMLLGVRSILNRQLLFGPLTLVGPLALASDNQMMKHAHSKSQGAAAVYM